MLHMHYIAVNASANGSTCLGDHFIFLFCEQVALCRVSVPTARTLKAAPDSSGVLAGCVDHHADSGGVGGPVPAESRGGSCSCPGGASGKAEPHEQTGMWLP